MNLKILLRTAILLLAATLLSHSGVAAQPDVPSASPDVMGTNAAQTITFSIPGTTFATPPPATVFSCAPSDRAPWRAEVELSDVTLIDSSTFQATVPAGMSEGIYSLLIGRLGAEFTVHHNLFTIIRPADGRPAAWQLADPVESLPIDSAAVAADGQLYLIGGGILGESSLRSAVTRAPIGAGGAPGTWQAEPALNIARSHLAAAATDGYLYAIGGYGNSSYDPVPLRSVERAPIRPDGSLGSWEQTTPLPQPAANMAAVVAGGQIFVLGTTGHDDLYNGAFAATINPDGTLGPWQRVDGPPLLQAQIRPRAIAVTSGDNIYFLGGDDGAVSYTRVRGDGSLEPWRFTSPTLANHLYGGAAAVDGTLYAIGGFHYCIYGGNLVERAEILADGSLGPWELAGSTRRGHGFATATSWGNALYAIGGMSGFGNDPGVVEYALVEPAAPAPANIQPRLWLPLLLH